MSCFRFFIIVYPLVIMFSGLAVLGNPMSDLSSTTAEPSKVADLDFGDLDFGIDEDVSLMKEKIAADVAGALTKGLEESLEGCKMDPNDPEGSVQKCLSANQSKQDEQVKQPTSEDLSKTSISDEAVTTSTTEETSKSSTTEDNEVAVDEKPRKEKQKYYLLKTAFLNLNEELKNQKESTDADIANLLERINKVIGLNLVREPKDSTIVPIPTETEIEEAVTSQSYDNSASEFWNTLFSVSDKVAMGLLMRIKSVEPIEAIQKLKTFLDGNEQKRIQILAETLKITKRRFNAKNSVDQMTKRSGFVVYDVHGVASEGDSSASQIKRSDVGLTSGFVGSDDDLFTEAEREEQLKRYGFVEQQDGVDINDDPLMKQIEKEISNLDGSDVTRDASERSDDNSIVASDFNSASESVGHDEVVLDQSGSDGVQRETQNHRYFFKQPSSSDGNSQDLFSSRSDNIDDGPTPSVTTSIPSQAVVDEFGRPIKRSGMDFLNVMDHMIQKESLDELLHQEAAAGLHANEQVPPEYHPTHRSLDKDSINHHHDPKNILFSTNTQSIHTHEDETTTHPLKKTTLSANHFIFISVASVIVLCILIGVYMSRTRLRRFYSKKIAYRRID